MNSEDEMIEISDNEGETPRRNGAFGIPGEGVKRERVTGERKGLESEGADIGGALRRMEGRGEAEVDDKFELKVEVIGSEIFGRRCRFSGAAEIEGDGGMGNAPSDGLKRVEGVKRTPCWRGTSGNCSWEEPGDKVRLSGSRDRARGGSYGTTASRACIGDGTGANWIFS